MAYEVRRSTIYRPARVEAFTIVKPGPIGPHRVHKAEIWAASPLSRGRPHYERAELGGQQALGSTSPLNSLDVANERCVGLNIIPSSQSGLL